VGLANAGVMQFEMTRSEREPDTASLSVAAAHARDACRLDPQYGEAWATLGFVLDRTGQRADALAASRRAVSLEPDNWRHHLRLAYVSWGEERLRESRRTLALLPGFPLAHWVAATVHVARQAFDEAQRELAAGLASAENAGAKDRFHGVALHWLLGLLLLARGEERAALEHFDRELAGEHSGHLYARECCANTWYAIGAVRLSQGDRTAAAAAFRETLGRVPLHPLAHAALAVVDPGGSIRPDAVPSSLLPAPERALGVAVKAALDGHLSAAVEQVNASLAAAPDGSALWTLPLEPVLRCHADPRWAPVLTRLRNRAA